MNSLHTLLLGMILVVSAHPCARPLEIRRGRNGTGTGLRRQANVRLKTKSNSRYYAAKPKARLCRRVRRMNVLSAKVGDVAWITRGLPAGLYVMQLKSANTERRKFIAVK